MSRDGSGNYTLPLPDVITGTTIESSWANTTLSDIEVEMTDSLSRSGSGGMLAALKLIDGTSAAPGLSFNNEASGLFRSGANDLRMAVNGTDQMRWIDGSVQINNSGVWTDIVLSPTGASDNETLRYDTATSAWVANSNCTITATGDLTAANVTATTALASTAGQVLLNNDDSTIEAQKNLNVWSKRGVTTGDDNAQQELILTVFRSAVASGVGSINLGYTAGTGWGAELTLNQFDYLNPGSLNDKKIELSGGWVRIANDQNFEVDHTTHGKVIEYDDNFSAVRLGGTVSPTAKVEIRGVDLEIETTNTKVQNLPTTDPATSTQLWDDNGIVRVSDGTGSQPMVPRSSTIGGGYQIKDDSYDQLTLSGGNSGATITLYNSAYAPNASDIFITGTDIIINPSSSCSVETLTVNGPVYSNARVLTNTNPSDEALKQNVEPVNLQQAQEAVIGIAPKNFQWIDQGCGKGTQYGFIAQEVQNYLPELVAEEKDGALGLKSDQLVPVLWAVVRDLIARVEELEERQIG